MNLLRPFLSRMHHAWLVWTARYPTMHFTSPAWAAAVFQSINVFSPVVHSLLRSPEVLQVAENGLISCCKATSLLTSLSPRWHYIFPVDGGKKRRKADKNVRGTEDGQSWGSWSCSNDSFCHPSLTWKGRTTGSTVFSLACCLPLIED